ncbi:MAG: hypothetical protein R2713_20560 [Ilumatobacteraceae bacterium]
MIAGLGRMLANEVCHRAKVSPFAMTGGSAPEGAGVHDATTPAWPTAWRYERTRTDMSCHRPAGRGARRAGEALQAAATRDPLGQLQRLHRGVLASHAS